MYDSVYHLKSDLVQTLQLKRHGCTYKKATYSIITKTAVRHARQDGPHRRITPVRTDTDHTVPYGECADEYEPNRDEKDYGCYDADRLEHL